MFLNCKSSYDRYGSQRSIGKFLIFTLPKGDNRSTPIRCFVRTVKLRQFGHFMMGFAHIWNQKISVSGAYGSDGLPLSVDDHIYEKGMELPKELYDKWNKGGGWNCAGSEAKDVREWAIKNIKQLSR